MVLTNQIVGLFDHYISERNQWMSSYSLHIVITQKKNKSETNLRLLGGARHAQLLPKFWRLSIDNFWSSEG